MQGTPIGKLNDALDLGTPSAPPVLDNDRDFHSEVGSQKHNDDLHEVSESSFSGNTVKFSGPRDGSIDTGVDRRYGTLVGKIFTSFCLSLIVFRCHTSQE